MCEHNLVIGNRYKLRSSLTNCKSCNYQFQSPDIVTLYMGDEPKGFHTFQPIEKIFCPRCGLGGGILGFSCDDEGGTNQRNSGISIITSEEQRMSDLVLKAWDFAARHHGNQEYGNYPYLYHLVKVAERVRSKTDSESVLIAAILHDVVEDTEATNTDVLREFNIEVARLVDLLTHHPGISYKEYLTRLMLLSDEAILIKVSDIQENLSNGGLYPSRVTKYKEALEYLTRDTYGIYE